MLTGEEFRQAHLGIFDERDQRKDDEHAAGARRRMAQLRRERYRLRDEQYKRIGMPPVRQGVAGYGALMDAAERRDQDDYLDDLDRWDDDQH